MPNQYDPVQVDALIGTIDSLAKETSAAHDEVVELREELRWAKRGTIAASILGLIGILVAVVSQVRADDAHDIAERVATLQVQFENERQQRTIGSCIQSNVELEVIRDALPKVLLAIVPNPNNLTFEEMLTTLRPEQQQSIRRYQDATKEEFKYRDCSPEGIAQYLLNPPQDPAKK